MEFLRIKGLLKDEFIVGRGNHGTIYRISPYYAIKIYHDWVESEANLGYEYDIVNKLYNAGRNVPFPVGLAEIALQRPSMLSDSKIKRGFIMQYIEGVSGEKTKGNLHKKIEFLYNEEIERCFALGLVPIDRNIRNSIYVPLEDKIYLVDFRLWV